MSTLSPPEIVAAMANLGAKKAKLTARDQWIRSFLSGFLLGAATSLAATVTAQSKLAFVGAFAFPVGFVMIMLMGLELVTGNFALIPMARMDGHASRRDMLAGWARVTLGNLAGCLLFALCFAAYISKLGTHFDEGVIDVIRQIGIRKTLAYKEMGPPGMIVLLIKSVLCNWMVTLGVVMACSTTSTPGKILAIWMPIFTFYTLALEHTVVNMFVIPAAMLLGAPISLGDWLFWNQIPSFFGNLAGGFFLTGFLLYKTYGARSVSTPD